MKLGGDVPESRPPVWPRRDAAALRVPTAVAFDHRQRRVREVGGIHGPPLSQKCIGKIWAVVYTDVVLSAACSSNGEPRSTNESMSAIARRTPVLFDPLRSATDNGSRSQESSLSMDTHGRLRRSRTPESDWRDRAARCPWDIWHIDLSTAFHDRSHHVDRQYRCWHEDWMTMRLWVRHMLSVLSVSITGVNSCPKRQVTTTKPPLTITPRQRNIIRKQPSITSRAIMKRRRIMPIQRARMPFMRTNMEIMPPRPTERSMGRSSPL